MSSQSPLLDHPAFYPIRRERSAGTLRVTGDLWAGFAGPGGASVNETPISPGKPPGKPLHALTSGVGRRYRTVHPLWRGNAMARAAAGIGDGRLRALAEAAWALLLAWYADWPESVSFGVVRHRALSVCLPVLPDLPAREWVEHCAAEIDATHSLDATLGNGLMGASGQGRVPPETVIGVLHRPFAAALADRTTLPAPVAGFVQVERHGLGAVYNPDAALPAPATWLLTAAERLIAALSDRPDTPVRELCALTHLDRQRLNAWTAAAPLPPPEAPLVHDLIRRQADATPERVAVEHAGRRLSYRDLIRQADAVAERLRAAGVKPGDRVALCLPRSPDLIVGLLGILTAGASFVPIDRELPDERRDFILRNAGVQAVLGTAGVVTGGVVTPNGAVPESPAPEGGEGEAYVIYTSGTTGSPKGVMVSHHSLSHYVNVARRMFAITPEDRVLQFASVGFDAAIEEIFPCLTAGGCLVLRDEMSLHSPGSFLAMVRQAGITVLDLPTAYWHEILAGEPDWARKLPPSLRLVIIGGEAAHPDDIAAWQEAGAPQLVNTYGPTEATVVTTMWFVPEASGARPLAGNVPIGKPIPGSRVLVMDRFGRIAPPGAVGELYIAGPGVASGYLGLPDKTAEKFVELHLGGGGVERFYRTGDRGRYREDGTIIYLGRSDNQIKIRGFRIELDEIVKVLRRIKGVEDAAVLVERADGTSPRLAAFVASAHDTGPDVERLWASLRATLPSYMLPARLTVLPHLPRLTSGKTDADALRALGHGGPAGGAAVRTPPRTGTERDLAAIWCDVLGVAAVDVHANFFDVGGNSLTAVRVMARIHRDLSADLPPDQLYRTPTVALLAACLEHHAPTEGGGADDGLDGAHFLEWRAGEAALPAGLLEHSGVSRPAADLRTDDVLLTGATGFLGAFLLRDLLRRTTGRIHCIVRARTAAEAAERLAQARRNARIDDASEDMAEGLDRVVALPGDLGRDRFGLDEDAYRELAGGVGTVIHAAAAVNMLSDYRSLRNTNVAGTARLLDFAVTGRAKAVHHVSSLAIFDSEPPPAAVDERCPLEAVGQLPGGYAQSKWVADRLMLNAAARGIDVRIYRCGRIWGDSRTGACPADDFVLRIVKGSLQLGAFPRLDMMLDAMPVDFVSDAILTLALSTGISRNALTGVGAQAGPAVFHLANPEAIGFDTLLGYLADAGRRFDLSDYPEWRRRLTEAIYDDDGANVLAPLLPVFLSDRAADWTDRYFPAPCTAARLAEHGLPYPRITRDLFARYLAFIEEN